MNPVTWLFFAVSVAAAREYSDEELASFPKLFHLDEYKRCLARTDGLYCLGTFELTPAVVPHPTYNIMKAYSEESYRHFNRTLIHRGYCLSLRCPLELITSYNATVLFERCADHYSQRSHLRASLHTLHYCRTHDDFVTRKPETPAEHMLKLVLYALVLANIVGTIYDSYVVDTPERKKSKLIAAFSIPANWRRLTFIREGGDPRQTALTPMEGVRVLALGCTTFAHASIFHYGFYTTNPEMLEKVTQRADGIFLSNGTSLIQAFMMMSCFLTGYNLLIYSQKRELGLYLLPLCIIKRVVRITPVHMLIVGYGATWWMYSRDGPLVSTTIGLESAACKTKFWSHFFFINNIVDPGNYCVAPTWFLPVNMHMYIVACTFTLLLWRRRRFAFRLYILLFIASCFMTAAISYVREYKALTYLATPEEIRRTFRDDPSFTEFYISSWGALPACFVGLIFAHLLFELDQRKIKLCDYKCFVYLYHTCFPLLFLWPLTGIYARAHQSAFFIAAYTAFDRPIYCILMVISLLGLFHVDGPLRWFFSWDGWRSLGRMSLTVMLLHWCINITIGARSMAFSTSELDVIVDWSATHVLTYAAAVPITVLVEFPMQKFLEALIF
ncbi:hypothetical protein PYW07_008412 [Mythimna separata]|uniref:Acyltransferase 3 domain-containing protein n=1 Tax=Mythimna separata TaxID=271217 RepID=A0AAD7YDQ8_MYTSE|nr:hypothetical protein PYW07_008412 [Mythimna separata]